MLAVSEKSADKKVVYFELLRIIAIIFVIFDHTGEKGRLLFTVSDYGFTYWISLALALLCKVSVPLFFMISGALLLGKEESYSKILKRVVRMTVVLFVISLIRYLVDANGFSLKYFVFFTITSEFSGTYWYLYRYIVFLLMLPVYRILAKNMTDKMVISLFSIGLLFIGIFPTVSMLLWHQPLNSDFRSPFFEWEFFYPVLGFYVHNKIKSLQETNQLKKVAGLCTLASGILLTVATVYMSYVWKRWTTIDDLYIVNKFFLPVFVTSMFVGVAFICYKIDNRIITNLICIQGSCVFGIYLLDEILRIMFDNVYERIVIGGVPQIIAAFLWIGIIYVVGFTITYLLRLIPIVRKYI